MNPGYRVLIDAISLNSPHVGFTPDEPLRPFPGFPGGASPHCGQGPVPDSSPAAAESADRGEATVCGEVKRAKVVRGACQKRQFSCGLFVINNTKSLFSRCTISPTDWSGSSSGWWEAACTMFTSTP